MKRLSTWILASVALALAVPALAERQPGSKTKVVNREASTPAKSARVEPKAGADGLLGAGQHRDARPGNVPLQDGHRHHEQHRRRRRDRFGPVLLHRFIGVRRVHASDGHHAPVLRQLSHRRHRRLPGQPRRHPARRAGVVVRNASRHLQQRPLDLRVGGHGHGAHVQPRQSRERAVGHGRHRVSRLALLRVREHHARRHDPRHPLGLADARGRRAPHQPRPHEHGPERRRPRRRRSVLLRRDRRVRHQRPARRQHPRGGRPPARRGPPDQQRLERWPRSRRASPPSSRSPTS